MNLLSYCHLICLLIGGHMMTSVSIREGNRWVWRTARSPNSATAEGPLNPFATFSNEDESSDIRPRSQQFPGSPFPFPRESIDSSELLFFNRRGQTPDIEEFNRANPFTKISPLPARRLQSSSGFAPSPPDTTFAQVSDFSRSPSNDDQRSTRQLNLGLAHFTIPSQLGRPVSVTTPTSNHLTQDSEPLISSYSSLDAKSPPLEGVSGSGRSLLSRRGQNPQGNINDLEPLEIKPLPIDISTLPLESTERAEGIRKLWSTLTSRNEFAKLFDSLAGLNRTAVAQQTVPFAAQLAAANSANRTGTVRDPSTSGDDSSIEVVTLATVQRQPQQVRQPQQIQDQRQSQPQRPQRPHQQQVAAQQSPRQELLRLRHQQLLERLRRRNEATRPPQRPVTSVPPTTRRPTTTTEKPQKAQELRRDPRQQIPQAIGFFSLGGTSSNQEATENFQPSQSLRSSQESPSPPSRGSPSPSLQGSSSSSSQGSATSTSEFRLSSPSQGGSSPTASRSASSSSSGEQSSVVQFPTRVESFVVRKLRLPGNYIANVVFVPAKGLSDSESSRVEILHSPSVLRFFQKPSVQKSIRELNDKDVILVVEEILRGSEKAYIISTVNGKRVYPKEHAAQSREDILGEEGHVWRTFLGVFGDNANVHRAHPSEITGARDFVRSQVSVGSDFPVGVENQRVPLTRPSSGGNPPNGPLTRPTVTEGNTEQSENSRTPRRQNLQRTSEDKPKFSLPDVFDPDNFNPFLPFAEEDDRTVKRSFPASSQSDFLDLSPPDFFTQFQDSPSFIKSSSERAETKIAVKFRQASKSGSFRRSPESEFLFSEERFMKPRAARDSVKWPWPDEVPPTLDDFFINRAQEDFKRR